MSPTKIIIAFAIVAMSSCGHFGKNQSVTESNKINLSKEEFLNHFESLTKDFISQNQGDLFKLSSNEHKYLENIYHRIYKSNETIFTKSIKPEFYILNSKLPFYFSMPGGKFFISRILLTKYLRSEELLIVAIAQETIRIQYDLYMKKRYFPTGRVTLESLLSVSRLPLKVKDELNKWTFSALRRANEDPYALLNLVQIQNKHQMDFLTQYDSISDIVRSEQLLKNYIATEGASEREQAPRKISPDYYSLIKRIQ